MKLIKKKHYIINYMLYLPVVSVVCAIGEIKSNGVHYYSI